MWPKPPLGISRLGRSSLANYLPAVTGGRELVTSLRSLLTKKVYAKAATLVMMSTSSGSVTPHCESVKVGLTLAPEVPGSRLLSAPSSSWNQKALRFDFTPFIDYRTSMSVPAEPMSQGGLMFRELRAFAHLVCAPMRHCRNIQFPQKPTTSLNRYRNALY